MPRKVRSQLPGATYGVMCRGDRREEIFREDGDQPPSLPDSDPPSNPILKNKFLSDVAKTRALSI